MMTATVSQKFDSILSEIGGFGRYQVFQYILLILAVVYTSAATVAYVFTAGYVPHRCLVEVCGDENEASTFLPPWWKDAIPPTSEGEPSTCTTYVPLNLTSTVTPGTSTPESTDTCPLFNKSAEQNCGQWVYEGRERTILTEFTLTCNENLWKLTLVGTINSFGCLVGLPFSGFLSDRMGRKIALIVTILGGCVFGIIRAFSPVYAVFVTLEFLEAIFTSGTYSIVFIIALEFVSPKRRELGGAVIVWSYTLGMIWLSFVAWAVREWNKILLVVYAPALLFISFIWLIPESVRWLMLRGRFGDAKQLIQRMAAVNHNKISDSLKSELATWENGVAPYGDALKDDNDDGEPTLAALKLVLHSKSLLLRVANCSFCWVTVTLVYYGLSLNAVSLAGTSNIYLNFALVSIVEAPAYIVAWVLMTHIGRRITLCTLLLVSGVVCLINPFIHTDVEWIQLLLYLGGKFAISGSFDTLYVFTAEIFPTRLRNSLMSTCSMVGRIGSMIAPQTPLLTKVSPLLPMVLFGGVAIVAGFLVLLLPETAGKTLPDSVIEAETMGTNVTLEETVSNSLDKNSTYNRTSEQL